VAHPLLDDVAVDPVLAIDGLEESLAHQVINTVIGADPGRAYLAVSTAGGFTVLRERETAGAES
jgi:hypothetical protein